MYPETPITPEGFGVPEPQVPPPPAPRKPYPGIWGAVLLMVLVQILANVVAGFLIVGYMMANRVPLAEWAARMPGVATLGIFANTIGFGAVIFLAWKHTKEPAATVFPFKPVPLSLWMPILPMLLGGLFVANEMENRLVQILPPPDWVKDLFGQILGKGSGPAELFFLAVVAPFTEEFLFRGVILNGFLPRYGKARAIVGTAILFGIIHLNPWQLVPAFVLGVLFAWWRIETGSLWPPLIAHAVTNGSAYLLSLGQDPSEAMKPSPQPLWLTALGVLLLAAGVNWGMKKFRGEAESKPVRAQGPFV